MDKVLAHWQAFRAGIEGTISGLLAGITFEDFQCRWLRFASSHVSSSPPNPHLAQSNLPPPNFAEMRTAGAAW
jgi:hypothetical protein